MSGKVVEPFFMVLKRFTREVLPGIQPTSVVVFLCLKEHERGSDGLCCPSQNTIAKETSLSLITVKRALKELEQVRAIVITRPEKRDQHRHNSYRLLY